MIENASEVDVLIRHTGTAEIVKLQIKRNGGDIGLKQMKYIIGFFSVLMIALSPLIYGLAFSTSETYFGISAAICIVFIIQKIFFVVSYVLSQRKILPYFAEKVGVMREISQAAMSRKIVWIGPFKYFSYALFFASFLFSFWLLLLSLALYLAAFAGGLRHSTVPAAIYLGASSPEQLKVCRKLSVQMMPLRLVSLLLIDKSPLSYMIMVGDNYRMDGIGEWRDTVRKLIGVVFIVFVDVRKLTAATLEEIEFTIENQYAYKIVIVHDGPDQIRELGSKVGDMHKLEGVFCFDVQAGNLKLFDWVSQKIIDSGGTVPSRDKPLSSMIFSEFRK